MKRVLEVLVPLGVGAALVFGYCQGRREVREEAEREKPIETRSHVTRSGEAVLIELQPEQVRDLGIQTQTVGRSEERFVVPEAAVVRDGDAQFVYREAGGSAFQKVAILVESATPEGRLRASGLKSGDAIVVRGAQLLLSEELKSQIHMGD